MRVGLFLDVDKTLTVDFIQREYAILLGCEAQYQELEKEFQAKEIDSREFGDRLINLFRHNGFTKRIAIDNFDCIKLHSWTDELLKSSCDKYLVSSGPSYYIDELGSGLID